MNFSPEKEAIKVSAQTSNAGENLRAKNIMLEVWWIIFLHLVQF
jgi:hypothetical protein